MFNKVTQLKNLAANLGTYSLKLCASYVKEGYKFEEKNWAYTCNLCSHIH